VVDGVINGKWLRELVLAAGADDVGFVSLSRAELDDQRGEILAAFPRARWLVSFVVRMNREAIRTPARSVANLEFHHSGDEVDEIGRRVVRVLEDHGIAALNPAMGFPMETAEFPGRMWVVSHKPVAVAAGLGKMGIHRNVIHPKYGNFILLGTIVVGGEVSVESEGRPIDFNPCLECKLCVAACPVGAISPDGGFNLSACYTHNYREFMGGFNDWAEQVVESRSAKEYRGRVSDAEGVSMWQSLSFGANYKAAYCLAVCPAGEDVIGPYRDDKKGHVREVVRPLQEKAETIYVLKNSDAEGHVAKRFPNKRIKHVGNSLRPSTVKGFLEGIRHAFQSGRSAGLAARYHFSFTGKESAEATVDIRDGKIAVEGGHTGVADLHVTADAETWIGFVRQEKNIVWAMVRRKVRLSGPLRLLVAFGKCFPN
jgi:NAD-dependent dihydropyrimidine dehydrogenase PreA subunit